MQMRLDYIHRTNDISFRVMEWPVYLVVDKKMAIDIINLAKNLNEWDIYNKWNSKIKTIENQRKKLIEQGYLTDAEATEMEGLMVEAQADYEYLIGAQKKKS